MTFTDADAGWMRSALGLARRSVGIWKRLALGDPAFLPDPQRTESWNRGAYLVNGPGHCGECHTPRDAFMIPEASRAFAGGPHPRGDTGEVPGLLDLEGDTGLLIEAYRASGDA